MKPLNGSWVLSLAEGISVHRNGDDALIVRGPLGRLKLPGLESAVSDAVQRMAHPGEPLGALLRDVESEAPLSVPRFLYQFRKLAEYGLAEVSVRTADGPLATLLPRSSSYTLSESERLTERFRLSRFAHVRHVDDMVLLESPLASGSVSLDDERAAALVFALLRGTSREELSARASGLDREHVEQFVELLDSAGMLTGLDDEGVASEEREPALRFWEFHDLVFHGGSRQGTHESIPGATFPWAGRVSPPPAVVEPPAGEVVPLFQPDLEQLQQEDPPLTRVMEERRSIREYGERPVSVRQLGEFLFRVARIRGRFEQELETHAGPMTLEFASRPYPSGGGLYEIDLHVVVQACDGLERGMYSYDAAGHRLVKVAASAADVSSMLEEAGWSTETPSENLQVLLVLSARLPRVAWKYSAIAYSLILKHTGVLLQSMYLAATAMGLAPCGVGKGDAAAFGRAVGGELMAQTAVGEFLLGSRPDDPPGQAPKESEP